MFYLLFCFWFFFVDFLYFWFVWANWRSQLRGMAGIVEYFFPSGFKIVGWFVFLFCYSFVLYRGSNEDLSGQDHFAFSLLFDILYFLNGSVSLFL